MPHRFPAAGRLLAAAALAAALCLVPAGAAHGHGVGLDTIRGVDAAGRDVSITVESPQSLEGGEAFVTVAATDEETGERPRDVTFLIGLFHGGEMVFRNYFLAPEGVLQIRASTAPGGPVEIRGMQDPVLGAWYGTESDPVEVSGPVFESAGLYTFEIELRTIDDPANIIEGSGVHTADVSIVERRSHAAEDLQGNPVEFGTTSYFDEISSFRYDPAAGTVTFEMPFDWGEGRMSHIPVVHEEVRFSKDFAEFFSPGYVGTANGIELFDSSVVIDDYTEEGDRIVHFVLLQDHLRYLKNEMKGSGGPLPDSIVFELASSDEVRFPLSAFTRGEDFEVNLSWDPVDLEPGADVNFVFTIRDGATGDPLRDSSYQFVILQGGEEVHRASGTARVGGGFEKFAFGEGQTGQTVIRFEDIRGTGQQTEFAVVVAPEFGHAALLVMAASVAAAMAAARRQQARALLSPQQPAR